MCRSGQSTQRRCKMRKLLGLPTYQQQCRSVLGTGRLIYLTEALNKIAEEEKILDEWRKSILVPIFKNKGDIMCCENYRGINLMWHSMKLYQRVNVHQLRQIAGISDKQFGFMKERSTRDAIFALRQLQEIFREGQNYVECSSTWRSTIECQEMNCIGACAAKESQISTSDW